MVTNTFNEIVKGRKTFFFVPDVSLFPENYLEDFLLRGYEAYFINNNKMCSLLDQVDSIMKTFKDCILFFNIDFPIADIDWPTFIRNVQTRYGDHAIIGVLYTSGQSESAKTKLKVLYLYDIGIKGGCVQLEYRKDENFKIIETILRANDANGRRKHVRAICTTSCFISFLYEGEQYAGKLNDISLSHFSCTLSHVDTPIPMYTKISDIQLTIKGRRVITDAILCEIRNSTYIFMFTTKDGRTGLDVFEQQRLLPIVYEIMTENCMGILNDLFYKR